MLYQRIHRQSLEQCVAPGFFPDSRPSSNLPEELDSAKTKFEPAGLEVEVEDESCDAAAQGHHETDLPVYTPTVTILSTRRIRLARRVALRPLNIEW